MKKIYVAILWLCVWNGGQAQVVIDNTPTVQSIVEDIFLGNGIFVANIQFNGQPANVVHDQFAQFSDLAGGLGITNGLCMSTGLASDMANTVPNGATPSTPYLNQDGDILSLLTNEFTLGDVASLEFDFIATGDICNFQYVFASDEYPEWVETAFNDHFGFFVSGPEVFGPYSNGGVNIALIPSTSESVGINTLNALEHAEFYVDNQNYATSVGFDAFTTVLDAHIENLVVGEVYHVKLIIADVSDSALDSGVFLRGDSFQQACAEQGPTGIQTETCMLSNVDAQVHYTQDCGTIYMTNLSEMNIETTNCYFEMGDGNTTSACGDNTTYTYAEPGVYTLKLVYEVNEFRTKYLVDNIVVSDTPPATPLIGLNSDGTLVEIQNWDGESTLQWYLNGVAIAGSNGTATPIDQSGVYTVSAVNGCLAESEGFLADNVLDVDATKSFSAFPNPADDAVQVRIHTNNAVIEVYNAAGQLVVKEQAKSGQLLTVDQPAGIYTVKCLSNKGIVLDQMHVIIY